MKLFILKVNYLLYPIILMVKRNTYMSLGLNVQFEMI